MEKNNEDILRYLSGLMNQFETRDFEKRLMESPEFKREYESVILKLKEFSDISLDNADESYFSNLIPRVRMKLEKGKSFFSFGRIYFAFQVATVIIFAFLLFPKSSIERQDQHKFLVQEVLNNLSDESVAQKYLNEFYSDLSLAFLNDEPDNYSLGLTEDIDFTKGEYINTLDLGLLDDNSKYENLSNKEFETIYNKINNITFHKVTK